MFGATRWELYAQMGVLAMLRRNPHERAGYQLYGAAVAAARAPYFYLPPSAGGLGVPDTLDGRFDLVGLHVFLVIRRLGPAAPKLAQAVFDAMFSDMDVNLREMGVGDLSVGKKVKIMWEAFHGRSTVYQAALQADDAEALAAALARNVWRGAAPEGAAGTLARIARDQDAHLAAQTVSGLQAGQVSFAPVGVS